jgi:hypothetical protein
MLKEPFPKRRYESLCALNLNDFSVVRGDAQLGKKTDLISQVVREMDVSPKLADKYAEIARQQQRDEPEKEKSRKDKRAGEPPLFRVSNHHTDDCGQPSTVDGDEPGKYFGYFANPDGEQAVFIYDYQTHEAFVRMGDAG